MTGEWIDTVSCRNMIIHRIHLDSKSDEWGAEMKCFPYAIGCGDTPIEAIKDMHENAKVFLDYYSEKGVKNEFSD